MEFLVPSKYEDLDIQNLMVPRERREKQRGKG
jgi:hypothetical protein